MSLNVKYLPVYNYCEEHHLDMVGSAAEVMKEILNYQADRDLFFRYAIALRELPHRLLHKSKQSQKTFGLDNFTLLEKNGDQEVVFGLVGQFWKLDYGQVVIDSAESFLAFDQLGDAKLILYFSIEQLDDTRCRVTTETRVSCLGAKALSKFRPYWYLIRPVSGLIRHRILKQLQKSIAQSKNI
ncbi:hypothetical protein [Acinetobacter rudis]|uniref:DUF2867 domain-containing protein n=1 Tax=Acinetobacter rudis CIP 110305 TaxID=421052 RepID=S3MUS9_9GAMM|nr:hypothetical protein [Acinetobacter rudis]EPF70318.1 hypothetical protein F945_03337 [Acinetobacter rudis CIP 110305]